MNKLVFFFLLLSNVIYSQVTTLNNREIEHKIDSIFQPFSNGPGLSIGLVSEGKLIIEKNFGIANLDDRLSISDSTVFSIASVSKEFTAYCILLLENQGKLSLQDEIHQYLPQLPDYKAPIFISDLLHHTSGLRDYVEVLALSGWGSEDVMSLDDVLAAVYRQQALNFMPRTVYHYSNTNYLLLEEIIKKITKQTLADYAKDNIFVPLQMSRTSFVESFRNTIPNLAISYHSAGSGNFRRVINNYAFTGPNGVYSTVSDLSKWITHIISLHNNNSPLFRKMIVLEKLPGDAVNNYAAGFFISNKYADVLMMYHDGYDVAYRAYMACFPAENLGFVLLSNNDAVNPKYYGNLVADMLFKTRMQANGNGPTREIKQNIASSSQQRKLMAGTYQLEDGFVFEIRENHDALEVILDGEAFHLYMQSKDEWSVKEFDYNIVPEKTKPGTILVRSSSGLKTGRRVQIVTPTQDALAAYVGKYYSKEVGQIYEIKLINGKVVVSHFKQGDFSMTPFTKDTFRSGRGFFDTIRFERSTHGQVIGFTYLGERATGIFFRKIKGI